MIDFDPAPGAALVAPVCFQRSNARWGGMFPADAAFRGAEHLSQVARSEQTRRK
jgi:hypothetical protein